MKLLHNVTTNIHRFGPITVQYANYSIKPITETLAKFVVSHNNPTGLGQSGTSGHLSCNDDEDVNLPAKQTNQ